MARTKTTQTKATNTTAVDDETTRKQLVNAILAILDRKSLLKKKLSAKQLKELIEELSA